LKACRLAGYQACLPPIKLLHSCDPTEATVPEAPPSRLQGFKASKLPAWPAPCSVAFPFHAP
jgi:hypothetical protein